MRPEPVKQQLADASRLQHVPRVRTPPYRPRSSGIPARVAQAGPSTHRARSYGSPGCEGSVLNPSNLPVSGRFRQSTGSPTPLLLVRIRTISEPSRWTPPRGAPKASPETKPASTPSQIDVSSRRLEGPGSHWGIGRDDSSRPPPALPPPTERVRCPRANGKVMGNETAPPPPASSNRPRARVGRRAATISLTERG
jgi:hypothetical protein